jgi:hypothetical protein
VACDGDAACTDRTGTERCNLAKGSTTRGRCVGCVEDADCDNPTPECGASHSCVGCTGDTACKDRVGGTTPLPECNLYSGAEAKGQCVQCTGDNEAAACGDQSCKRTTGTCTLTKRGMSTPCTPCAADSECEGNEMCVMQKFGVKELQPYCFYVDDATQHCADIVGTSRPYSRSLAGKSLDGVTGNYCFPPTTCKALEDATAMGTSGGKPCVKSTDCGEPGLADGICGEGGNIDGKCTYNCAVQDPVANADCPDTGFTSCEGGGAALFCQ